MKAHEYYSHFIVGHKETGDHYLSYAYEMKYITRSGLNVTPTYLKNTEDQVLNFIYSDYGYPGGGYLRDLPRRALHAGSTNPVVMNLQSTVIVDSKPALSLTWGFTINSKTSTTVRVATIRNFNSTTQFHQGAVISVIKKQNE